MIPFPNLNHFTEKEWLDPTFDGNPYKSWEDFVKGEGEAVAKKTIASLLVVDEIREALGFAIKINSDFRYKDPESSPHHLGGAVDIVPVMFEKGWVRRVYEFLKNSDFKGTLFMEWQGNNEGWCHIEGANACRLKNNAIQQFWIGYPKGGIMIYDIFKGRYPWEMA